MDPIEKFLRKLTPKSRAVLLRTLKAIGKGDLARLDIKPLQGRKGWFRCRVGNIRIIFIRTTAGKHVIYDVQSRGRAYRRL